MDKYEYKLRADEIRSLISDKKYKEAAAVADTIDWKNVKNGMMLCTISDLYKVCRRYEDSRDVLLLAYQRNPQGRMILYSLCELSIKLNDVVNAVEYYKEFLQVAARDNGRFILQYKLYTAQEVSLEERIAVLEELQKRECKEKWMYELAYLYHRVGFGSKCIEECDQIVIYFGEGKYVIQALDLKRLHTPLSESQQALYDRLTGVSEPEIQIKDVNVGMFSTMNLEKELANNLRKVLGEDEIPADISAAGGNITASNTDTKPIPGKSAATSVESDAEGELYDKAAATQVFDSAESENEFLNNAASTQIFDAFEISNEISDSSQDTKVFDNVAGVDDMSNRPSDPAATKVLDVIDSSVNDVAARTVEPMPDEPYENVSDNVEDTTSHETDGQISFLSTNNKDSIPVIGNFNELYNGGSVELDENGRVVAQNFDDMLSLEGDGQISLVVPEQIQVTKQITGQLCIDEVLLDWERKKYEKEALWNANIVKNINQKTRDIMRDFERSKKDDLMLLYAQAPDVGKPEDDEESLKEALSDTGRIDTGTVSEAVESKENFEVTNAEGAAEDKTSVESETATETISDASVRTVIYPDNHVPSDKDSEVPDEDYLERYAKACEEAESANNVENVTNEEPEKVAYPAYNTDDDDAIVNEMIAQLEKEEAEKNAIAAGFGKETEEKDINEALAENADESVKETVCEDTNDAAAKTAGEISEEGASEVTAEMPDTDTKDASEQVSEATYEESAKETASEDTKEENVADAGEAGQEKADEVKTEKSEAAGTMKAEEGKTEAKETTAELQIEVKTEYKSNVEKMKSKEDAKDAEKSCESSDNAMKTPADKTFEAPVVVSDHPEFEECFAEHPGLTDEQAHKYETYIQTPKGLYNIVEALSEITMDAGMGNVIIGRKDIDSALELGKLLITDLSAKERVSGKIAKTNANSLNSKSVEDTISKLFEGAIIIEDAENLRKETLEGIRRILEKDGKRIFIILIVASRNKANFIKENHEYLSAFTVSLDVEPLTNDQLVKYAKAYAYKREYSIDEMGTLALHTRIEQLTTNDHSATLAEVREIIDGAISHVVKITFSHFFELLVGKRYDKNDMTILGEKDINR